MRFSDFTTGGTPNDGDYLVGHLAAGGAGSDTRWTFSQILTYLTPKTLTLAGVLLNGSAAVGLFTLNNGATQAHGNTASYDAAYARIAQNWTTTAYQSALYISGNVTANTGSNVAYEKIGLFIEVLTNDPGDVSGGLFTHERIISAIDARGAIANSNVSGSAFGIYAEAGIRSGGTGDGFLVAAEFASVNNGADQSALNKANSKYGIHVVADGTVNSTAALFIDNTSTNVWYCGLYSDTGSIAASGKFLSLFNEAGPADLFYVDKGGILSATPSTTAGRGAFIGVTQSAPNVADANDMGLGVNMTLTAASGTNEAVLRGIRTGVTNNLTTGGGVQSLRGNEIAVVFSTGSATVSALGLYINEAGAGTVTNSYGVYVDTLVGTNKYGFYDNSGGGMFTTAAHAARVTTATPAAASMVAAFTMGSANVGFYWGTGAPSAAAAQGSLYIRTDGGANTRLYSNTSGSTTWSAITSA